MRLACRKTKSVDSRQDRLDVRDQRVGLYLHHQRRKRRGGDRGQPRRGADASTPGHHAFRNSSVLTLSTSKSTPLAAARKGGETADLFHGLPDVLVLRGGWWRKQGCYPLSLLRNNGNGTFADVTEPAGLPSAAADVVLPVLDRYATFL